VTDLAGNAGTFSSPASKIDKSKPVASGSASPPPNSNGWNTTDVTVTFTGSDSVSGIASCSAPVVLSNNGANQSASGTCMDFAGNVSDTATVSGININKTTPPAAQISGLPAPDCQIWPPNKQMVQIAAVTATGVTPGSLSVHATSNEPVASSDIIISGGVVQVRADRNGKGNGRIYTVTATAIDSSSGKPTTASGSCTVPHDSPQGTAHIVAPN
jgi:hypothetical protein